MHPDHDAFLDAIENRQSVAVVFDSKRDRGVRTLKCAPLDYGPWRLKPNDPPRYHFWNLEGEHQLSLAPEKITAIVPVGEDFDPSAIVDWEVEWFHPRDWAAYS